jgi:hypothetical protein
MPQLGSLPHLKPPASDLRRGAGLWGPVMLLVLLAALFLGGLTAAVRAAAPAKTLMEDLQYRLDLLVLRDAARARVTLTRLGAGHYLAEVIGEPQGVLKVLTGDRREVLQTEMVCRQGKLAPLVYREESRRRGKRRLNEYRFDYDNGTLQLWQLQPGKKMVLKWQTPLTQSFQDPLTAFYNCRFGLLGPIRDGETIKVPGIPYPKPEEIEVRIGPETPEGRKAMVSIVNQVFNDSRGCVFAFLNDGRVPRRAWTEVMSLTIRGELLPGSKPLPGILPELQQQGPS